MSDTAEVSKLLSHLNPLLASEIEEVSTLKEFPPNTELVRDGQYVKVIPLVAKGLIKVFTRHDDKELVLYHIQSGESCIMSFSAGIQHQTSKIFAITEEKTLALLLPVDKIILWMRQYPEINTLFFQQYHLRYTDLLETIQHILFDKMDKRLLDYLIDKSRLTHTNPIHISHRQIAMDLGTAREVVSRVMKKLEHEGKIQQLHHSEILLKV